jgi:serine/threonine protein kinase
MCGASQTGKDQALTNLPQQEAAMSSTGRLPPGRMLHQRYRLVHTLGQGGMGAVYVAQDTQLGDRLVAVKEMSSAGLSVAQVKEAEEAFEREAHLLASLLHPNLPRIYDNFTETERSYLVMDFIEGHTLEDYLRCLELPAYPPAADYLSRSQAFECDDQ